ncbi:MAG: hypothetical protein ACP5D7_16245 [Limnospira sp.]
MIPYPYNRGQFRSNWGETVRPHRPPSDRGRYQGGRIESEAWAFPATGEGGQRGSGGRSQTV